MLPGTTGDTINPIRKVIGPKYFAIDVKTKRDKWRIILQPLDEDEKEYDPLNIDEIAGIVKIVEIREVSAHYE